MKDFLFLSVYSPALNELGNQIRFLDPEWSRSQFPDVISISDIVVAKLGYGILSECIANRTCLLYVPRHDFGEFEILEAASRIHLPSKLISIEDFSAGRWSAYLNDLLEKASHFHWPELDFNGADVAAEVILSKYRT
jgi:hypothetical protein